MQVVSLPASYSRWCTLWFVKKIFFTQVQVFNWLICSHLLHHWEYDWLLQFVSNRIKTAVSNNITCQLVNNVLFTDQSQFFYSRLMLGECEFWTLIGTVWWRKRNCIIHAVKGTCNSPVHLYLFIFFIKRITIGFQRPVCVWVGRVCARDQIKVSLILQLID